MTDTASIITAINPVEGKRYKMSMKGDVSRLTVRRIKKYLANSCKIAPEEQLLKYNGVEMGDDVLGGEVGITTGSTITVERRGPKDVPFLASPTKQALEMETLDQQRSMLQHERMRREEEFRRHQDTLSGSLSQAEHRRRELEREKLEKEQELKRLAEIEAAAVSERERLRQYREEEAEREAMRARDLEARKEQLASERALQRQLEMQKLENERKKMLLEQQKAEYEAEKARAERERKEHLERIMKQELDIKKKEVDIERVSIEADRQRQELEVEKALLQQQRLAEGSRLNSERMEEQSRIQGAVVYNPDGSQPAAAGGTTFGTPHHNYSGAIGHQHHQAAPSSHQPSLSSTPGAGQRSSSVVSKERELERLRKEREAIERGESSNAYESDLDRQIEEEKSRIHQASHHGSRAGSTSAAGSNVNAQGRGGPGNSAAPTPAPPPHQPSTIHNNRPAKELALENLAELSDELGVRQLTLDDNNTCVVFVEEKYSLIITFDPATERIYLYSTLATFIPTNNDVKLKLYEFLMEGALLGRDMCGGGVGCSLKNEFILMSTSIYLPQSATSALKAIMPHFLDSLIKWRGRVKDLLANEPDFSMTNTTAGGAGGATPVAAPAATPNTHHVGGGGGGRSNSRHRSTDRSDSHAEPEYPMVGIEVTDGVTVDGVLSKYDDGVVVVSSKGPASRAGILPNDYIRAVNGRPVTSLKAFQTILSGLRPHTTVPFSLDRAGAHLVVSVLIGSTANRPGETRYKNSVRVNQSGSQDVGYGL